MKLNDDANRRNSGTKWNKFIKHWLMVLPVFLLLVGIVPLNVFADYSVTKMEAKNMISAGDETSLFLHESGMVYSSGYNGNGELGAGTTVDSKVPVRVLLLEYIIAISSGMDHSLALKNDGTVFSWGWNYYGQLGDSTTTNRLSPVNLSGLTDIIAISAGGNHSLALKKDGTVYSWGRNEDGQLGDGSETDRLSPTKISGLTDIITISAGGNHSLALKKDGTVYSWGRNDGGQLGDGSETNRLSPTKISGLTDIIAIAAGYSHSLALKKDGTVFSWGYNYYGQLGDGSTTDKLTPVKISGLTDMVAIVGGFYHSLALKKDGTVFSCGCNDYGQLGDASTTVKLSPVKISGLTDIVAIAGGSDHSLALKKDGTVFSWGKNRSGSLGDNSTTNRFTPVNVYKLPDSTHPYCNLGMIWKTTVLNGTGTTAFGIQDADIANVPIKGNVPPLGKGTFDHWEVKSGTVYNIGDIRNSVEEIAQVYGDATIQAIYKLIGGCFNHTPFNMDYTGKPVGPVISDITKVAGVGNITAIYYEGTSGTTYAKSTTPPINCGNYNVTIDVTAGTLYTGANNLLIMSYGLWKTPPTKEQYNFNLATKTYNGSAQGISVTPKSGAGAVGSISYKGVSGTSYAVSTKAPINVGTYEVTIEVPVEGTFYAAHTELVLGTYKIEQAPTTKNQLNIVSLADKTYNGKAQGISVTPKAGVGAVTVYYTGSGYAKSKTAPTNSGTYNVSVDVAATANYKAVTGLAIGSFKINPVATAAKPATTTPAKPATTTKPATASKPSTTTAKQPLLPTTDEAKTSPKIPVYRLYNEHTGEHFYTTGKGERDHLKSVGWNDEGVGWNAPTSGTPVYRIYNPNATGGDHYYTTSKAEAQANVNVGWKWDNLGKPAFYAGGTVNVYVKYNPNAIGDSGSHNYTTSKSEHDYLLKIGWKYGAVAWKAR